MKERTKFALERERLFVNVSELCRAFGVNRPTGYTWPKRNREAGYDVRVLEDRSLSKVLGRSQGIVEKKSTMPTRKPLSNPRAMTLQIEATLVAARQLYPRRPEEAPRLAAGSVS